MTTSYLLGLKVLQFFLGNIRAFVARVFIDLGAEANKDALPSSGYLLDQTSYLCGINTVSL